MWQKIKLFAGHQTGSKWKMNLAKYAILIKLIKHNNYNWTYFSFEKVPHEKCFCVWVIYTQANMTKEKPNKSIYSRTWKYCPKTIRKSTWNGSSVVSTNETLKIFLIQFWNPKASTSDKVSIKLKIKQMDQEIFVYQKDLHKIKNMKMSNLIIYQ